MLFDTRCDKRFNDTLYMEDDREPHFLSLDPDVIVSEDSELQTTTKLKSSDEIHKLEKRRITRDSKNKRRRKKPARAKSLSKLFAAKRLNGTALSQLDEVSCFTKTNRKKLNVPSIENAYLVKLTRLVFASIKIIPSPK